MVSLESLARSILQDRHIALKWVVGGILLSIPVVNLLVLGYWLLYARRLLEGEGPQLPEAPRWDHLVVEGLRMAGLFLAAAVLPVVVITLICLPLSLLAAILPFSFLAQPIIWLPVSLATGVAPLLWLAATYGFIRADGDWRVLLEPLALWRLIQPAIPHLVVPVLAFWGLAVLSGPIFGFGIFLGFSILIAYAFWVFSQVAN